MSGCLRQSVSGQIGFRTKKVGQLSGMSAAEQSHEWLSAAECPMSG